MNSIGNGEMKTPNRSEKLKRKETEIVLTPGKDNKTNVNELSPKTSDLKYHAKQFATPKSSRAALGESFQTPRRSCRKSVKPSQDYDDIISKSFRDSAAKKQMGTGKDKENQNSENVILSPRWTPAKVGRVSNKRTRKSRRTANPKKQDGCEFKVLEETECEEDVVDITKKAIESHEIISKTMELVVSTENAQLKGKLEADSKPVGEEVIKQKQVDEIVDNIENLNVETEYNTCQKEKEYKKVERECDHENGDFRVDNDSLHFTEETGKEIKESRDDFKSLIHENVKDKFGCSLKLNDINISDLGLNPIKDEQEEINDEMENVPKLSLDEAKEMPCLKFCDDDNGVNATQCITLNDTFEVANESVIVIRDVDENCSKSTEEVMEILQVSDDDDDNGKTPRKCPHILLTDTELKDHQIPKELAAIKAELPSTPKSLLSPKLSSTHKLSVKHRFPTPYRNKQENISCNTSINIPLNSCTISLTTMEPREIVLGGIRKRSLSISIDGSEQKCQKLMDGSLAKGKKDRVVSFYSPANQTAIIGDLDLKYSRKLKNQNSQRKEEALSKFVTTRRKRSISFDESTLLSKLPRPVVGQTSISRPLSRTKLPNFAAIHQKQFQKMENLEEHVNRKQERSNNLINSVTKLRPVSAQKSISIVKNSNNITCERPKALKKIDLENIPQVNKFNFNTTVTKETPCRSQKMPENKKNTKLLDRKLVATKAPTPNRPPRQQQSYKYLKTSQITNIEKRQLNTKTAMPFNTTFNQSTSLMVKPTTSSSSFVRNTSVMNNNDKTVSRLQRHIDLFKGRGPSTRSATSSSKQEILRGVRSNRRFELQMQHRKNLEN